MLWEHKLQMSVSTAFWSCTKLSRVFLQLHRNTENMGPEYFYSSIETQRTWVFYIFTRKHWGTKKEKKKPINNSIKMKLFSGSPQWFTVQTNFCSLGSLNNQVFMEGTMYIQCIRVGENVVSSNGLLNDSLLRADNFYQKSIWIQTKLSVTRMF